MERGRRACQRVTKIWFPQNGIVAKCNLEGALIVSNVSPWRKLRWKESMRRKLALGIVFASCLLACAVVEAKATEVAHHHMKAGSMQTAESGVRSLGGTRLDGTIGDARWWDDKKSEVLSRLLERPKRWATRLEEWSDHLLNRVMALGAPGIVMAYIMLMLSFSVVHAFPQKTEQKVRPKRRRR